VTFYGPRVYPFMLNHSAFCSLHSTTSEYWTTHPFGISCLVCFAVVCDFFVSG